MRWSPRVCCRRADGRRLFPGGYNTASQPRLRSRGRAEGRAMSVVEGILNATPDFDPAKLGLPHPGRVYAHLCSTALVEHAIRRREGVLTDLGALSAFTGNRTGRSPKDKFTVKEPSVAEQI